MLLQVWVYEFIYGPRALGDPINAAKFWNSRITTVRALLDDLRARGEGETLEALLWENALAFWLVSEHDHAEAMPLIEHNLQQWTRMLSDTDPWVRHAQMLGLCAEVNRALANDGAADAASRRLLLQRLEADLQAATDELNTAYPRSPLHYLALNRLADLNDPEALNRPERAAELRASITQLIDDSHGKESGTAREGRRTQAEIEAARRQATQPAAQP
jgi:hypothetical protein